MTAAQNKKLHSIVAAIETLERQVSQRGDQKLDDALRVAKDRLMDVLDR